MNILIVEDDIQLNYAITEFFKYKDFNKVISVFDGLQAIDKININSFTLYIIDINIPEINGLELVKYIRKIDLIVPIIIITASLEIGNLSNAFDNGCSEYIKKPFHLKELDIRINNLLSTPVTNIIKINNKLVYDINIEELRYKNTILQLRYKEKRLCTILLKNINTIVSSAVIYDYVWEGEIQENYPLRQLLLELRKKLPYNIIQTKIKKGYMISQKS